MKKLLIISLTSLSLVTCCFYTTGCGSPIKTSTRVAGTTTITIDAAMQSWGEYVRLGKASVEQRMEVRAAYMKYQNAMFIAEAQTLNGLTNSTGGVKGVLTAVGDSSASLISLIQSFTNNKQ